MLSGKKVIVTAGLGGIGFEMTKALLLAGATVFPTTRCSSNIDKALSLLEDGLVSRCMPMVLSLESDSLIDSFVDDVSSNVGAVYGLVNTAVCRKTVTDVANVDRADWAAHFGINVFANARLTRSIAENAMEDGGSVVNVSSFYSVNVPDNRVYDDETIPTSLIYASSKAAQNYVTQYYAVRYAPRGIRVNSILAGGVENKERQTEHFVSEYSFRTPMMRMAKASEFNEALLFLLSPANSYCTGQLLSVDGGWGLL